MYYTYILKSHKDNRYYIGSTADLNKRVIEHNSGSVKSTKSYTPWSLYYSEEFKQRRDAILRETKIKSWKKRSMIEKLKFMESRVLDSDKSVIGKTP